MSYEDIEKGLPQIDTSKTLVREVCPPFLSGVECRPGKYRRVDGLCNNLENPTWGAAHTPFQRLIGPLYSDSISSPRISVTGHDLPLSRIVSRTIHPDEGYHDHAGTVMIVAWGQFMDHDLTLTGTPLGKSATLAHDNLLQTGETDVEIEAKADRPFHAMLEGQIHHFKSLFMTRFVLCHA